MYLYQSSGIFLLTPLREGRQIWRTYRWHKYKHFYSRPCGRGDQFERSPVLCRVYFYSRPCGRGDKIAPFLHVGFLDFYSRPCGRGDCPIFDCTTLESLFLLTPLREGRRKGRQIIADEDISTHAPAGGATSRHRSYPARKSHFYSRPCGRGDRDGSKAASQCQHFYSRPCGRGDAG